MYLFANWWWVGIVFPLENVAILIVNVVCGDLKKINQNRWKTRKNVQVFDNVQKSYNPTLQWSWQLSHCNSSVAKSRNIKGNLSYIIQYAVFFKISLPARRNRPSLQIPAVSTKLHLSLKRIHHVFCYRPSIAIITKVLFLGTKVAGISAGAWNKLEIWVRSGNREMERTNGFLPHFWFREAMLKRRGRRQALRIGKYLQPVKINLIIWVNMSLTIFDRYTVYVKLFSPKELWKRWNSGSLYSLPPYVRLVS